MTSKFFEHLDDDLGGASVLAPKSELQAGTRMPADFVPAIERTFTESCKKCRGSGQFVGWSGRAVGNCFECKGTGKLTFNTSADQRAKGRAQAAVRRERRQDDVRAAAEAWSAEHKAEALWLTQTAARQRRHKMQLGTASITEGLDHKGIYYVVEWMNHGNFLRNEPRWFNTEQEAREWCKERGLHVVGWVLRKPGP